ncbi:hypothetical protein MHYP_G00094360 [Metynnis hypsauchen]
MTMVDETWPLVKDELEKIYISKKIKEKMQENELHLPCEELPREDYQHTQCRYFDSDGYSRYDFFCK